MSTKSVQLFQAVSIILTLRGLLYFCNNLPAGVKIKCYLAYNSGQSLVPINSTLKLNMPSIGLAQNEHSTALLIEIWTPKVHSSSLSDMYHAVIALICHEWLILYSKDFLQVIGQLYFRTDISSIKGDRILPIGAGGLPCPSPNIQS